VSTRLDIKISVGKHKQKRPEAHIYCLLIAGALASSCIVFTMLVSTVGHANSADALDYALQQLSLRRCCSIDQQTSQCLICASVVSALHCFEFAPFAKPMSSI
jgi:hypothetical protein